jgi:hypothetical protein
VLPRPNVVLIAQAVLDGLATASFDAASPRYPRFVGCTPIVATCSLVVFGAQAFRDGLSVASLDITHEQSCPGSHGGIAIVAVCSLVVLVAHTFTDGFGVAPFDAASTAV